LEGERQGKATQPVARNELDDDEDVEMSAAELDALDQMEETSIGLNGFQANGAPAQAAIPPVIPSQSRADSAAAGIPQAPPAPAPKRRMVITHDKFMALQSLIVLHLSAAERETGRGIDRDELVDWYLELRESEIEDVEELEYEKELITKMLRKLVKVNSISMSAAVL
jgi:DNA replication licensing factor MCM6